MYLQRWDPFREYRRLARSYRPSFRSEDEGAWAIPLDIVREGDEFQVRASVPGVKPADISVTIEDGVLTITGETASETGNEEGSYLRRERRSGSFRRSLRLPESVDAEHARSTYANGVVTIALPKAEDRKARKLTLELEDKGTALDPVASTER
ncbi:MAG: Hsp20/alpha crystallin family protein [Chloroflexi bacterium]|nr:Hsp20/alpha crystallin family protein [Chloroflexota bacterium]